MALPCYERAVPIVHFFRLRLGSVLTSCNQRFKYSSNPIDRAFWRPRHDSVPLWLLAGSTDRAESSCARRQAISASVLVRNVSACSSSVPAPHVTAGTKKARIRAF